MIVTIDDFGISEQANENTLLFVRAGKIDRVSIMMNGLLRPADIETLLRSGVKLDIHLDRRMTIDEQRKLSDTFLRRFFVFIHGYFFGGNHPAQVSEAWQQQLKRFRETFKRSPDGLNSHEHVHFFPSYFRRIILLANEHNVSFLRFGRRHTPNTRFVAFVLNVLRVINKKAFERSGLTSSDYLISWDWVSDTVDFNHLTDNLKNDTQTEVIFHPERPEELEAMQRIFMS